MTQYDILKLKKAYGCKACGGHLSSSTGGLLDSSGSEKNSYCDWILSTDKNKQINLHFKVFFKIPICHHHFYKPLQSMALTPLLPKECPSYYRILPFNISYLCPPLSSLISAFSGAFSSAFLSALLSVLLITF